MMELNKINLEEMYHKEFFSIREIADFFEINKSIIYRKMITFNIPRRETHEMRPDYKVKIPCEKCGKLKLKFGRFKTCRDCWDKEKGRERYPCGALVPLRFTPRLKRRFKVCLNCRGKIASWNKSGYCSQCWKLPGMKKYIANVFCKNCGKAITGHGETGRCYKCSWNRK